MKTWAEVNASPEFHAAPAPVKANIRGHYKKSVSAKPEFQALDREEQGRVLRAIDGDGGFSVEMAAVIVAAAQREKLGRSILEPTYDEALDEALKGAKAAEHYLDVPLKDRPREPFQDEFPGHLDKPLRALLGFVDDAIPEYGPYKFWFNHSGQSLEDRLRNVLALSATQPPVPVDANAALNLAGFIRTPDDLTRRLPGRLPPLPAWPPEAQEKALTTDAEAALKHGLDLGLWGRADRDVQTALVHVLAGVKDGLPRAFRPDAVPAIVAAVKQRAYELLARQFYRLPSPAGRVPIDPEAVGELVLAAPVLAPGMAEVADDFPALFAVAAGLAACPHAALGRLKTFVQNGMKAPLTPAWLLGAVTTGGFSLVAISQVDDAIFQAALTEAGAHPEARAHLTRDAVTAAQKPLLAALATRSAQLATQDFKQAQANVRQKLGEEVQKQLAKPPPRPAPSAEEPDEIHRIHEDGASALVVPARLAFLNPDPEDTEAPPVPKAAAAPPAAQEQTPPPNAAPAPLEAAPAPAAENPVHAYLVSHPIAIKAAKKAGLLAAFRAFPDILAKAGASLDETMDALIAAKILPDGSDYNDLLDALDRQGVAAPSIEESAASVEPPAKAVPEADPVPAERPKLEPALTVKVVEVDPAALLPTKTPAEIEPARIRGVQQRFPEGKGYPTVTAYEAKDGLHLIDGHHRTMVAKERQDTVKAAVIPEAQYVALRGEGIDQIEISYRILEKAGEKDAMEHLRKQYPNRKFGEKNTAREAKP